MSTQGPLLVAITKSLYINYNDTQRTRDIELGIEPEGSQCRTLDVANKTPD